MNSYTHYLTEKLDNHKVQWLKTEPVTSSVESKKLKELINVGTTELYDVSHVTTDKNIKVDKDRPILVYFGNNPKGINVLEDNNIKQGDVYNRTTEANHSRYKDKWHELFGNSEYLPKTVTDKSKISELTFPIIAKPSDGHSGIGIFKFKTLEEAEKELKTNKDLATFSEMVKDVDTEYRFIFVKGDLFLVHERIAIESDNRTINTKDSNDPLSFLYIEQDMDKEKYDVSGMVKWFSKKIDMDFYALDILLDKKGKYWLIESNSGIGMGGNTMARSYEAIYNDYYNRPIPSDKKKIVEYLCSEYYKEIAKTYPTELKQSKNPKTYENI